MKIGTKTVLFGIHFPPIHSFFMGVAWLKLYGFTLEFLDPRLHLCFWLHDIGYWGKKDLDGKEGENHPVLGATIMSLFGAKWEDMCLFHSGTMVKKWNEKFSVSYPEGRVVVAEPSKLYAADKLASPLYPKWLYKFLSCLTGEWKEYAQIMYKRQRIDGWEIGGEARDKVYLVSGDYFNLYTLCSFDKWWHDAMPLMKQRAYTDRLTTHGEVFSDAQANPNLPHFREERNKEKYYKGTNYVSSD